MRAAFDGSKEIAFTILSMTLSLAAVFIPVLFMGGIVGRLLHEFAVTIGVAILVSGFVSISLTPMLCSRFLKPPHAQKHGWFYNATERMFDALAASSTTGRCGVSLRFRAVTMAVSVALLVGTGLPVHAGAEGLPAERGSGALQRSAPRRSRASASTRWCATSMEVAEIVAKDPDVAGVQQQRRRRARRRRPEYRAASSIDLKPRAERKRSGRSDHRGAAAEAGAGARRPRLHGQPAADQPRRPAGRAQPLSVHAAGHRHRRAVSRGRRSSKTRCASCRARGRQQRPADQEPADPGRHGPRQDLGARPDRQPGRDGALQRLRHAAGLADLRAEQSVPGDPAGRAASSSSDPAALSMLYVRSTGAGALDSAQHRRERATPTPGR